MNILTLPPFFPHQAFKKSEGEELLSHGYGQKLAELLTCTCSSTTLFCNFQQGNLCI